MNDLLAGRVHVYMNNIPSFIAHVGTGAVRPLALAAKKRSDLLPDVPTTSEAGLEGMEMGSWYGLVAPDGTPPEAISRLHDAMQTMPQRSEEHTSELQQLMRNTYAGLCLTKKNNN